MAMFEQLLNRNIFFDYWKQVQQYIFSSGRFMQLITLKPIEIYKIKTELELDTAKINLHIKSNVENIMQRRIERTINLLTANLSSEERKSTYNFDIIIKAEAPYKEADKFFNHHFAKQTYTIEEDKYYLYIEQFIFNNKGTKAVVQVPFTVESKRWFLKRKMQGIAELRGSINFHHPMYVVKTRNLNYELQTKSWVLKILDYFYHEQLITFLDDFLQYNFEADLQLALKEAQTQIDSFQSNRNWINGKINSLQLERITIENEGVNAVFLAQGKLFLIP